MAANGGEWGRSPKVSFGAIVPDNSSFIRKSIKTYQGSTFPIPNYQLEGDAANVTASVSFDFNFDETSKFTLTEKAITLAPEKGKCGRAGCDEGGDVTSYVGTLTKNGAVANYICLSI